MKFKSVDVSKYAAVHLVLFFQNRTTKLYAMAILIM